jgi:hypothetical protein
MKPQTCKDHVLACRPDAKLVSSRDYYQRTVYAVMVGGAPLLTFTTRSAKEAWKEASKHLFYHCGESWDRT